MRILLFLTVVCALRSAASEAVQSIQISAHPDALAVDAKGNFYIADTNANQVYFRNQRTGQVSIFAGTGKREYNGDNIDPKAANLNAPAGLAVDADGSVYIAEHLGHRIRKIAAGRITTFAGTGEPGTPDSQFTDRVTYPQGVCLGPDGIYFTEPETHQVRKVLTSATVVVAGSGRGGYDGDGGPALNAGLEKPAAIAVDAGGRVYIADAGNHTVRVVVNGMIFTLAGYGQSGNGQPGQLGKVTALAGPLGIAVDSQGDVIVADTGNRRVLKIHEGMVQSIPVAASTLEGRASGRFGALALDIHNQLYTADSAGSRILTLRLAPVASR